MSLNTMSTKPAIGQLDGPPTIAKLQEKVNILTESSVKAEDSAIKYAGMVDGLRADKEKLEHDLEIKSMELFQLKEKVSQLEADHEREVGVLTADRDHLNKRIDELNKAALDMQKEIGSLSARTIYDTEGIDDDQLVMDIKALVHQNQQLQKTLDDCNETNTYLEKLLTERGADHGKKRDTSKS